ncbi:MAG: hypothetical protein ABFR33_08890, partial [Verrucomicrobiota bacterium]
MNIRFVGVLTGLLLSISSWASTLYVDVAGTNPVPPYSSWATAATNIQDAVDVASSNDVVWVTNGYYLLSAEITVTNNITVQSVNGSDATIVDGGGSNRCFNLGGAACLVSGFTITNGYSSNYGGGVSCTNTTPVVSNSIITGNSAKSGGGGSYYGTLNNCTLTGNYTVSTRGWGGGSCYSTLYNCLLTGNSAGFGGGIFRSTANNCTITDNLAYDDGGGIVEGTANNCIIYYNTAFSADANWSADRSGSTLSHCCTEPLPGGTGNITNNPVLVGTSHIHADSPCVGAGSSIYALGTDIDGEAWAVPPSIGCDEPLATFSGGLSVSVLAEYTNVVAGYSLAFSSKISGEVASSIWTFGDGASLL